MIKILSIIWQLPQFLLGGFISLIVSIFKLDCWRMYQNGVVYVGWDFKNCFSLGYWIFINQFAGERYEKHEYGHSIQSRILGIFYLPVVGLTSIYQVIIFKILKLDWNRYKDFLFEWWADKLGGVKR